MKIPIPGEFHKHFWEIQYSRVSFEKGHEVSIYINVDLNNF